MVGSSFLAASLRAAPDPVEEMLPVVGTADHGHAYPGATVPFGMVQLSPDTPLQGWDAASGYHYSDSVINGFSHTHLAGTGCGCLGDVLLMPTIGPVRFEAGSPGKGYCSRFSHERERATPGDYRVVLDDSGIAAELTATARSGFHKYIFPASGYAHVILDLAHGIGNEPKDATLTVENDTTLSGSRVSDGWGGKRVVFFVMKFSKPFGSCGIEQNGRPLEASARFGRGQTVKASVNYSTTANEVVLVKVGLSGTGVEGARKNLAAEIPGWDFDGVRAEAVKQWKHVFDAVRVESADAHVRNTFYANLYGTCLAPVLFNDVDGAYRGMDEQNHSGKAFQNYTTFSLWDTYRAEHPLLTLLQPGRVDDMVQSLVNEYRETGVHSTPIWPLWGNETWCMIGYHSVSVIADACGKGFQKCNPEAAYAAMRDTAMQDRNGLKSYRERGYVASATGDQATSRTIEYSFDDWCLARMAEALGHKDDAQLFYRRSANYRNLFDRNVGFFRGRKASGAWRTPFSTTALVCDEYTEADAWQYAFGAQHDVPGMINLYGGDQAFIAKLDALFSADSTIDSDIPDITGLIGQYSQGDEQCHHVAYLYNYAGAPYKTQQRVRQVMRQFYSDTPSGQCGNVDCGQMAAWYVFSALGFYPMNPNSGVYIIGSPVVDKAVIRLDPKRYKGRTFTVIAENNGLDNIYIQSASLNNRPLSRAWFTCDELTNGGTLRLVMGPNPNPAWGSAQADRPPATMPADFHYAELPAPSTNTLEVLPLPIRVICGSDQPAGEFVPDPNMLSGQVGHAGNSVDTSAANAAPQAVYQSERYGKDFTFRFAVPKDQRYRVRLHFAEIFDAGAGRRIQNVEINGRTVLTDLDIFVAAGGMNKALVKEFPDIVPDDKGNVVIRVASNVNSPDRNAKISGIEILSATQ
jgi:predicted alpha-1,2-mannosidase